MSNLRPAQNTYMSRRIRPILPLTAIAVAAAIAISGAGDTEAFPTSELGRPIGLDGRAIRQVLDEIALRDRAIERYRDARAAAHRAGVEFDHPLYPNEQTIAPERLRRAAGVLESRARQARSAARDASFPTPESVGVSSATLSAIASCESGGNPAAVNPAGYYGKYQFSVATWAGIGGSGNPAAAGEAEQDYRAALLYARSGPGQWPVCGVG